MTMTDALTESQQQHFHEEGYLVVEDVLTDADLQPVIDEVAAEVDLRAAELVHSGALSRDYAELDFEHRLSRITDETVLLYKSIMSGLLSGPAFFNLICHPALLDLAESLCGDELIASSVYRLRPKVPGLAHGEVPWHQDAGYTDPYCDRALMVTMWIPLVDATEENGCLWVQPRAHRGGIMQHGRKPNKPYLIIDDGQMPPELKPRCCPVRKGGVLLLTNMTPHASFTNATDGIRWSMDLRYQSAAMPTNAPITRLEGEVTESDGAPPACYPPEADFLVRSRKRPHQVVTEAAVFHDIRTHHLAQPWLPRWDR